MPRRLTFDRERCLGCRSCELACAVAHSASGALLPALDEQPAPRRRVSLALGPRGIAALRCAQCDEPLCVFSCKSGALRRSEVRGPKSEVDIGHRTPDIGRREWRIEFDEARCVGCLMCYMVCAWGIRRAHNASWDPAFLPAEAPAKAGAGLDAEQKIVRCDVCADRETPACVTACPTKALSALATRPAFAPAIAEAGASAGKPAAANAFTGHLLVVGSSAAGIAACEAARELAPDCRITMVTPDAQWYSRPLLPYVLGGRVDRDQLAWRAQEYVASLGVEVMAGTRAIELRPAEKVLVVRPGLPAGTYDSKPREISFDRLVITTGASATKLKVPGAQLAGVFQLRELDDLAGIEGALARRDQGSGIRGNRAVVVGGGNVGLQAAEALARRGVQVTVVVRSGHLLSQMVDAEAGRRVGALFERHGVAVRTGRDVVEIAGSPEVGPSDLRVHRVRLDDGEWIDADLVIVGKGIQPNVEWLRSSGVRIGRGVIVDRTGRTSVDGVFAAGDCAEVDDPIAGQSIVSGIWPIAYEMGRAAGAAAVGADRRSVGALRMNSSRFFGTPVISIGEARADRVAGASEHVVAAGDDVYRKLVMKDGRLIGAVLYGDVSDAGLYYRLYRDGTALDATAEDLERTRARRIAALAEQLSA